MSDSKVKADVAGKPSEAVPPKSDSPPVVPAKSKAATDVVAPSAAGATVKAAAPPTPAKAGTAEPAAKPVATPKSKPVAKKPAPAVKATARTAPVKRSAPKPAVAVKESKMADTVNKATDTAKTFFADANDRAKGQLEKGAKFFENANEFHKGNLEAVVESSKIAAKGAEDIAKYSADYARAAVEKANENARKFAAVKSPTEFLQLQSEIAREAIDSVASETAKFTENYLKLLGAVAQPYQNRFAVAAEKVKAVA